MEPCRPAHLSLHFGGPRNDAGTVRRMTSEGGSELLCRQLEAVVEKTARYHINLAVKCPHLFSEVLWSHGLCLASRSLWQRCSATCPVCSQPSPQLIWATLVAMQHLSSAHIEIVQRPFDSIYDQLWL